MLANMAANEDTRHDVVDHSGLSVLLKFLLCATPLTSRMASMNSENTEVHTTERNGGLSSPTRPEDFAQYSAAERVLQKSAIAISRYSIRCVIFSMLTIKFICLYMRLFGIVYISNYFTGCVTTHILRRR